jgi:hypothetical protein
MVKRAGTQARNHVLRFAINGFAHTLSGETLGAVSLAFPFAVQGQSCTTSDDTVQNC